MSHAEQGQPRLFAQLPLLDGDWLDDADHRSIGELVDAMICQHRKIRPYRGTEGELVDIFSRPTV
ncbi:hypothetical protein [Cupriavidus necator]|uniref:hypothetical protein n=1 Tax=Cupriavidus necator TaxID=106590 RepID=UPI00339D664B